MEKKLVHIGTFGKPLGLKGEIKILMKTSNFKIFKDINPYLDETGKNKWIFENLKFKKNTLVVQLSNFKNRESVEILNGKKIFTYKKSLPKIKKNEFYVSELVGCIVKNSSNEELGKITKVDNFGAGDLINIKKTNKKGKSFYMPMNKDNIIKIDIKKRVVFVKPIKGILN